MRIGELATRTGVPAKTIRYWEQLGLLPQPARTAAGDRDYPPQAATRLGFVRAAQSIGMSPGWPSGSPPSSGCGVISSGWRAPPARYRPSVFGRPPTAT